MLILRNAILIASAITSVPRTGTAQITVTEPPPAEATIKVDASRPLPYRIPRTIFGSFLEPIGNSTHKGLWAEILVNPSFEENLWDTNHIATMVREEPGLSRASALGLHLPWEPLDNSQGNRYEPHWGSVPNSWRSLEVIGVPGQETGVKQKVYLPVHRVLRHEGKLFAKYLAGLPGLTIQIRKHDSNEVLASALISVSTAEWSKYSYDRHHGIRRHLERAKPGLRGAGIYVFKMYGVRMLKPQYPWNPILVRMLFITACHGCRKSPM